jgi:hypothetical protein
MGHAAWICIMDLRHRHGAWKCSTDMQQGQAVLTSAQTSASAMQHGHTVWTSKYPLEKKDMQHGNAG